MVACSVWPTALPKGAKAEHTGNPVREGVLKKAASPYIAPGDYPMNLLVFGGSQGASIMGNVPKALALLPPALQGRLNVSHQARDADHDTAVEAYRALGIRADVQPFFEDIPERIANAQLVIARAGASSVADITVIGRPSVLIPLAAAIRDEQTANAAALKAAHGAIVIQENDLTPEGLAQHIGGILSDPDFAQSMAGSALALGRPDATQRLAALVENLRKQDSE